MNNPVRVIIADDHTLFVNGLQSLLRSEEWIELVDIASNGKELLYLLQHALPDIILLDINMPEMNGLEAARHIRRSYPGIHIVMLSTYNDDHIIEKARNFGVNGYLLKNSSRDELFQTIHLVMNGQTSFPYRSPQTNNSFDAGDPFMKQLNLTKREVEIIQLVKNGFTNQQIAEQLFLSIFTVETHRKNIMQKLELKSPAALMKFILQNNL